MRLDLLGRPCFADDEVIEQLYKNPSLDIFHIDLLGESASSFDQAALELFLDEYPGLKKWNPLIGVSKESFDQKNQETWHMPGEYRTLDIYSYVMSLCQTQEEQERAHEEYEQFDARDMLPLLRYMRYLVDVMRKHNVVWGVGRGSSVSSYVLYKIGIHRIDSLKYNLDWREFLR